MCKFNTGSNTEVLVPQNSNESRFLEKKTELRFKGRFKLNLS